jgi:hypothetical protein
MFHATIQDDDQKPFCISGYITPNDLGILRDHLIARLRTTLRVEVRLPASHTPWWTKLSAPPRDAASRDRGRLLAPARGSLRA